MSTPKPSASSNTGSPVQVERTFKRFNRGQRWEHGLLFLFILVMLLTGLPQKYQSTNWGQWIISSPERLIQLQNVHHIFALLLTALALYHLVRIFVLIVRRILPGDMLPTWQDVRDAWQMLKYLLFISREKPRFGKYNFEQKFTYWFVFFAVGILMVSGFILWFPIIVTRFLPGGVVPAAFLAHGDEAVALAVFILIWHVYHVHLERLNLSIFTGRLSEDEMRQYHALEYEHLTGKKAGSEPKPQGGSK
jgi:formate dehydrogenase subunit gamma